MEVIDENLSKLILYLWIPVFLALGQKLEIQRMIKFILSWGKPLWAQLVVGKDLEKILWYKEEINIQTSVRKEEKKL